MRANFGIAVAATGNLDGDSGGVHDIVVSSIGETASDIYPEGAVHILTLQNAALYSVNDLVLDSKVRMG